MYMSSDHSVETCKCCLQPMTSVCQTLEEIDFERGIWSAAVNGDNGRVKKYLSSGGNPDVPDSSSFTALHYAARNGHVEICEMLLNSGAQANTVTRTGHVTALHRAAYCGHCSVIQLLLKHGARTSLCDTDGKTALHKAAEGGRFEAAKILLEADSSVLHSRDKCGRMPVDCVPSNNCDLLCSLLS